MHRRHALAAALAALAAPGSFAQAGWPARPIRFIVPFPPGGGTDIASRLIAEKLTTLLGWTVVIDNKPGAGGNIGIDAVAKAAPDGYTIGMGQASNLAINPSLYAKMPFDALKDLTPIASIAEQPVVLVVRTESPLKTLADFVQAAKAKAPASAWRRRAMARSVTWPARCWSGAPASSCCRCRTRARARP